MTKTIAALGLVVLITTACGPNDEPGEHGHAGDAGQAASAGKGPGSGGNAGSSGNGGELDRGRLVEEGESTVLTQPRPSYGALRVVADGARRYVIESRRDVEAGPVLPWRSRFRLAAYDGDVEAWAYLPEVEDGIGDVVVHPSGELTLSLQRLAPAERAYELVRLTRDGEVVSTTVLEKPATLPESDYGPDDRRPLFRMKAPMVDATSAGWIALLPDGEGLAAAILSYVTVAEGQGSTRLALALATFDWDGSAYSERWARIVEGTHSASPAAWAYDEFRWRDQAVRPTLLRDESRNELVVARAWNRPRCQALASTFGEFTPMQCILEAPVDTENERLPLALTRFTADGERIGTHLVLPDEDAVEQLPFALAMRDGLLAVAGSVVRTNEDGSKKSYPASGTYVDYDGYVALYDGDGRLQEQHDFNLGRGDVLAALRWTDDGIVAVGSAGWDRWQGGMSVSRGADPLIVWVSLDGTRSASRVVPSSDGTRHFTLHDVAVFERTLDAYGFSDGPMTHSADGGNTAARTFGPLVVRLGE